MSRHHPPALRQAAVADYYASPDDTIADVAARHGIPRATLGGWVNRRRDLAYVGAWEVRGGVSYPLLPERRKA